MASGETGPWGPVVYLTADQIRLNPVIAHLSDSGRRLVWTLQGPLSSAISVMAEHGNPDGPREPYLGHGGDRHPVSNDPVTEQPVATLTVMEEYLGDWQNEWYTINQEGFDEDEDEDVEPEPEGQPPTFEPLVVTASNGEFVSIHDYVSAVHPWLMARREQILRARHVADDDYVPGPDEERLMVSAHNTELVRAEDEQEGLQDLRSVFESTRHHQEERTAS